MLRFYPSSLIELAIQWQKAREVKQDLSELQFEKDGQAIINSMELDEIYFQCAALLELCPTLKIKVILHYSPFLADCTEIRSKLKKPIAQLLKLTKIHDVCFFADTSKLCQVYSALLNEAVTLVPIPHAKRGKNATKKLTQTPCNITYFGTYSEAKSAHLIPEVIRRISPDVSLNWAIYITYLSKNSVMESFEDELSRLKYQVGFLDYKIGPFNSHQIEDIFSKSHIFLIPYHSHDYEIQSSGVVMEALVSGKIPLVSRSMADAEMLSVINVHLTFRPNNETDMVKSLEYVALNYDKVMQQLRPLQQEMERFHNPDNFMNTLLRQTKVDRSPI